MSICRLILLFTMAAVAASSACAWGAGSALNFDGINDYVNVSDNSNLEGFAELTVSVWVKKAADNDPNEDTIVSKWGPDYTYALRYDSANDELDWLVGNGAAYDSSINSVSIEDNQWHHIAAVYDGTNGYVYLDGAQLADTASMGLGIGSNNNPLRIGVSPYPAEANDCFAGSIDDVRIYAKALSSGQIEDLCHSVTLPDPNLIAYWKFDAGQGQTAGDSSGNGYDGTLGSNPGGADASDPAWTDSELPYCRYYVDATNGDDSNNGLSPQAAFQTIQTGIDTSKDCDFVLVYPDLYIEDIDFGDKTITVTSINEPAVLKASIRVPGFYAVTFNSEQDSNCVFKNFIVKDSYAAFLFGIGSSPTVKNVTVVENDIGAVKEDSASPNISNSIFWNNVYGDLEDQAEYSLVENQTDLVGHWKFDTGSGSTAYDSAGTNDGTIYGDTFWTTGQVGDSALDFDGSDDYVVIADDDSLTPPSQITLAYWIYNRGGQDAGIYKFAECPDEAASPGNSRAYYLTVDTGGQITFRVYSAVNSYDQLQSNSTVAFNQWHHIAATFDANDTAIYIDGQLDNSAALTVSSIMEDAQPLIVGGYWSYCGTDTFNSRLNGKIDELCIYDRPLSAGEIWRLYEINSRGYSYGPLFVDPNNGDYRLKSEGWRWSRSESQWVYDDVTSPCIDAGNPGSPLENEVMTVPRDPGNVYGTNIRINMGAYGRTSQAGIGPHGWAILSDLTNDAVVDYLDLRDQLENWLKTEKELPGDLNRNGIIDMIDYAILASEWMDSLY